MASEGDSSERVSVAVRGDEIAFVSALCNGRSAEQYIASAAASWHEAVAIIWKVARALDHAHQHGHLYGTIETSDIVVGENGDLVLCTFRETGSSECSTYTAPEQLTFWTMDPRTDLYRLGVVLYKLLTRRDPFRASDPETLCEQVREDAPQPPRQLVHGLPKPLDSICLRLLAKAPEHRIESAAKLADELRLILREFDDRRDQGSVAKVASKRQRYDFVIIRCDAVLDPDSSVPNTPLASPISVLLNGLKDRLAECGATEVAWDGDEALFRLDTTGTKEDATARTVAIGASLLLFAHQDSLQSNRRCAIRVESAELDSSDGQVAMVPDRVRSSDLVRRVPRVAAVVSQDRVQVDRSTWQCLRRWMENSESGGYSKVHFDESGESLRLEIQPEQHSGPMFGPASSLAIVKARWQQAREGLGQMVLIIGEEGTGKSRLVAETIRSVEPSEQTEVVVWTCVPRRQDRSFHPLARSLKQQFSRMEEKHDRPHMIKAYLTSIGVTSGTSAECLSSVLAAEDARDGDRARPVSSVQKSGVQDVILKWLGHATKQSTVLFVVEDLQWADAATLDLISQLASNRLYEHLLLIATFRPDFETMWGSRAHQTHVALRPLSKKHVKKMIQSRFGNSAVDDPMLEHAIRVTGGVPMYIDAYLGRLEK